MPQLNWICLDEEADLEAGNVEKPQHIEGGQIDATQEFEDGKEVSLIFIIYYR